MDNRDFRAVCRRCPIDGVGEHLANFLLMVDRVGFVTGTAVEDFALPAIVAAAAAEDVAAFEPTDEDERVWLWDAERLAIHFGVRDFKVIAQAFGNRVSGIDDPDALTFVCLAPLEVAGRTHQAFEDFREVTGMEDDQAHAFEDALLD